MHKPKVITMPWGAANPADAVANASALISIFGKWPSFQKAEVLSVSFQAKLDDASMECVVHVFKTIKGAEKRGTECPFQKHTLATIRFEGVALESLVHFTRTNVIDDFRIRFAEEAAQRFEVAFVSHVGTNLTLLCNSIRVLHAEEYTLSERRSAGSTYSWDIKPIDTAPFSSLLRRAGLKDATSAAYVAGRAVTALKLKVPFGCVSLDSKSTPPGHVSATYIEDDKKRVTRSSLAVVAASGPIAELLCEDFTSIWARERTARERLKAEYGENPLFLRGTPVREIFHAAEKLLRKHVGVVVALADRLIDSRYLSARDVRKLLRDRTPLADLREPCPLCRDHHAALLADTPDPDRGSLEDEPGLAHS